MAPASSRISRMPVCPPDMPAAVSAQARLSWAAARRIITTERCFNVREGISSKDDRLHKRFLTEPLPEGPKKGAIFTAEDEKKMHDSYYKLFGWDEKGIPTEATLKSLGLDYLIEDIETARKSL